MSQMDAKQAASLIEQWIAFYDMDNPQAWDRDDYTFVQQSCRHMRAALQVLRGKGASNAAELRKLADGLEEFIEDSFMDDPQEWEPENRAFVKQAMEAMEYTAGQLRQSKGASTSAKPATGGARYSNKPTGKPSTGKSSTGKGNSGKATSSKGASNKSNPAKSAPSSPNKDSQPLKSGTGKGQTTKPSLSTSKNASSQRSPAKSGSGKSNPAKSMSKYTNTGKPSTTGKTSTRNTNERGSGRGKTSGR